MQNAKQFLYLSLLLVIFMAPAEVFDFHDKDLEAANNEPKTLKQLLEKRKNFANNVQGRNVDKLVNILIVPGHDDEYSGTEFQGIREVDLNRILANKLHAYLSSEQGINAVLASSESGYNPIFEQYFKREENRIEDFIKSSKKTFTKKLSKKDQELIEESFHNTAPEDVAQRLYGINRWVDKQNFDFVIHIHFNDHRGRKWNKVGDHDGFSIYAPSELLQNHELSRTLADSIFNELKKVQAVSSLESEKEGVIEGHELIALGANETLLAGSVLIEYGYIYEPQFLDINKRDITLDHYAYLTYAGIKKMLNEQPYSKELQFAQTTKDKTTPANLLWQFEKALHGEYPPAGKSLRDCPILGYYGECSRMVN